MSMKRLPFPSWRIAYRYRKGVTVTEVVVVIGIISLLAALIIPAVLSAREGSRKTTCRNHLRQQSIGLQGFLDSHGRFPEIGGPNPGPGGKTSFFFQLLPYVDQRNLYELPAKLGVSMHSEQIRKKRPTIFTCPSDPENHTSPSSVNYAHNEGWVEKGATIKPPNTMMYPNGIMFQGLDPNRAIRPAQIRDGMSNTAAIAEILITPASERKNSSDRRAIFGTRAHPLRNTPLEMYEDCSKSLTGGGGWRGRSWTSFAPWSTAYNHVMPPDSRNCDLLYSAMNNHGGIVHVALCDGSVRPFSSSIDVSVWQAVGTRDSGDSVQF